MSECRRSRLGAWCLTHDASIAGERCEDADKPRGEMIVSGSQEWVRARQALEAERELMEKRRAARLVTCYTCAKDYDVDRIEIKIDRTFACPEGDTVGPNELQIGMIEKRISDRLRALLPHYRKLMDLPHELEIDLQIGDFKESGISDDLDKLGATYMDPEGERKRFMIAIDPRAGEKHEHVLVHELVHVYLLSSVGEDLEEQLELAVDQCAHLVMRVDDDEDDD